MGEGLKRASAAATFTVDGEIFSMQSETGHVFCYGVHVPSVTRPGIAGPVRGSVSDWIQDVLYQDYRRQGGRKVRITLEILTEEEATAAEVAPDEGEVAECGYCTTRITYRLGEWMDDDFGSACMDPAAPFVPHKPKAD